jgi:hypothetical protein
MNKESHNALACDEKYVTVKKILKTKGLEIRKNQEWTK